MKTPPYFDKMHSGSRSIVLEDGISYDSFASAAARWAKTLDLRILNKADGPDVRVWDCEREGKKFWLTYDDWFPHISLEPQDGAATIEIQSIGVKLGATESAPVGPEDFGTATRHA